MIQGNFTLIHKIHFWSIHPSIVLFIYLANVRSICHWFCCSIIRSIILSIVLSIVNSIILSELCSVIRYLSIIRSIVCSIYHFI